MKQLHLISNAHLDPVWLWEWEEGMGEAISTFRVAADFCESYDGYLFNHNEALLYMWVEEYEPELFTRIQNLVKQGKWHIMGGWYLQPDCNMPSGESFVRQIVLGRTYFKEKFGVEPRTAINFDPFGHTRGLVQILAKSGFDSYLFTRPRAADQLSIPDEDFKWVGYDGSAVKAHRAFEGYQSFAAGWALGKIKRWMEKHPHKEHGLVLWGIGNHGGGPSRLDLEAINDFMAEAGDDREIMHSTPEQYFDEFQLDELPPYEGDLNPWAPGCYTSQIRIKQKHRMLENELYMVEKMASSASIQGYMDYPTRELRQALHDLVMAQFHDILPGSSVQPVEEWALRLMDHGIETLQRIRAQVFFKLASGQEKPQNGEIPIFIYNPHPYPVRSIFECEIAPAEARRDGTFYKATLFRDGMPIPFQVEKELSHISVDWRKRMVFEAELLPSQMNRFDCVLEVVSQLDKPKPDLSIDRFVFKTEQLEVVINKHTGLMDKYNANGFDYVSENALQPLVIRDNEDPWGSQVTEFRDVEGCFTLVTPEECARFSGVRASRLEPVRVIEDGEVRTVIETVLSYRNSYLCQKYMLPKKGTEVEIESTVYWNEKDRMLKLSIPTLLKHPAYMGQVAYGVAELPGNGMEAVAQKWVGAFSEEDGKALTCINDGIYGSDFNDGELRLSLLRSPAYAALQPRNQLVVPQERFSARIDQGERRFRFWLNAGHTGDRLVKIDREALWHNEKPFALSLFPSGNGSKPVPTAILKGDAIQLAAFKRSEDDQGYILRLFNPTDGARRIEVNLAAVGVEQSIHFTKYEIRTFYLRDGSKVLEEVPLLENGM